MKQEKFIYTGIVKEYLNSFINLKNVLQSNKQVVSQGLIDNVAMQNYIKVINDCLSYDYQNILDNMNEIIKWWTTYNENVWLLSTGFTKDNFIDNEFENVAFKKATEIINEELK